MEALFTAPVVCGLVCAGIQALAGAATAVIAGVSANNAQKQQKQIGDKHTALLRESNEKAAAHHQANYKQAERHHAADLEQRDRHHAVDLEQGERHHQDMLSASVAGSAGMCFVMAFPISLWSSVVNAMIVSIFYGNKLDPDCLAEPWADSSWQISAACHAAFGWNMAKDPAMSPTWQFLATVCFVVSLVQGIWGNVMHFRGPNPLVVQILWYAWALQTVSFLSFLIPWSKPVVEKWRAADPFRMADIIFYGCNIMDLLVRLVITVWPAYAMGHCGALPQTV
eukprot:gb/GFBE01061777.1/.p1 GENE.gb/GFBE01061777.1/~~gb/GFBE01061777.1/.p1  ORF type:complete len:282 (+),score=31.93 gb/GFBE01061777.1/:1-846(+)